MYINDLISAVHATVEAVTYSPDGTEKRSKINLQIRRVSFRHVAKASFKDAMLHAHEDPDKLALLLAGGEDKETGETILGALESWTITDDPEGKIMRPVTAENILELPFYLTNAIGEAVAEKLFPGPATAKSSLAGSEQTARSNSAAAPATKATRKNSLDATTSSTPPDSSE